MPFFHGIKVNEKQTQIVAPVQVDSAVQVVVGLAPVNMGSLADPLAPQIAYSYDEAIQKMGMSADHLTYTICESIKLSFANYNVSPLIMINVLDPSKHKEQKTSVSVSMLESKAELPEEGVIPSSLQLTQTEQALQVGTDYNLSFDTDGKAVIERIEGGKIASDTASLTATYDVMDPTAVEDEDILAGVAKIREVYPRFGLVPGTLIVPGYSGKPAVYNAMTSKTDTLNGVFRYHCLVDLDTETVTAYDQAQTEKNKNNFVHENSSLFWPMVRVGEEMYHFSAAAAALIADTDYNNDGVPYVSLSNKSLKISGLCLADGSEVILDMEQANLLNSQGINTAINMNGWKAWGNRTACYPGNTDIKDCFIPCRRMYNWWANQFILSYFSKVDDPINKRLIESIVDSENIKGNAWKQRYQVAEAKLVFDSEDNPVTDLINGIVRIKMLFSPYPPAEQILATVEYDTSALQSALE